MMKVGRDKIEIDGKFRKFGYKDVEYNNDGWAYAGNYLPADYDILYLKIKGKPVTSGWCVGKKWDGLLIKKGDRIIFWKRKDEKY